MARSVEATSGGAPSPPETEAFRKFGDGTAGRIVAARLQGYDSSTLAYIDVVVNPDGTLSTGGGAGTTDVSDRAGRLLGHVTVDNASLAVTGTFWQGTQPVSAATLPLPTGAAKDSTLTDSSLRVGGTVTVTGALTDTQLRATPVPVSGTFWQSTQPVSLATNTPDVTDRSGRLLGHVTVDNATLAVTQSTSPWVTSRNWTLASGTDSVNVGNFPATQPVTQSTSPWVVSNGGTFAVQATLATDASVTTRNGASVLGVYDNDSRVLLEQILVEMKVHNSLLAHIVPPQAVARLDATLVP